MSQEVFMKRMIGSKVKIKSIEWYNKNKWPDGFVRGEAVGFNELMSIHCGAEAIIEDAYLSFGSQCYSLNIDDGCWTWVEYMFEKGEVYGIE